MSQKVVGAKLGKKDVLQAVVLADDFTTNLSPGQNILSSILLPVVNVPLLDYLIETLISSRIHCLYLYCSNHIDSIKQYIHEKNHKDINISLILSDGCQSLGDALRDIDAKGWVRGDFVLIRGDAFTNANLKNLLDIHRSKVVKDKGAAMTMILRDIGSTNVHSLKEETNLVVTDGSSTQVLFYKKLGNEERKFPLELEWFLGHERIEINTNFLDSHVYLCSPSVLPLFSDNFDFQTMEDFIRGVLMNEEILDTRIYSERLSSEEYALPITSWKTYHILNCDILRRLCYPLVPDTFHCLRNFVHTSRSTYKHRSATLAKGCILRRDSLVGPMSILGENAILTRTIIGDNCSLGRNVNVENSYILSNVTIGDNCTIKNSILFPNCTLDTNVILETCILSPGIHIAAKRSCTKMIFECENANMIEKNMFEEDIESNSAMLYFNYDDSKECDDNSTELDESSVDNDSLPNSPIPDDTNMFLTEVIDSLLRGYQDKLNCENLILEINSSRYAYNVGIREVTYNVVKAILSLPFYYLSETKTTLNTVNYQKTLRALVTYFKPIIVNYIKTENAQEICLQALEEVASTTEELLSFLKNLLHVFYEYDVLSEEKILEWYEQEDDENAEAASTVRKAVQPFIKWLQEAEEDSSEDD
ncbi:translation initiation factor eIF-2B subunit epsilon [Orussus abietinus]|uniref:translation initiation factor eIF-2B subunit epsilon n=1 Tax=Orussus abietinus TaxID=222816 RepID=UPI0006257728|nr:translation initiation factor eIF-2B subunit epsilon [Orussus abietinus]